jgi:hypothetical protein
MHFYQQATDHGFTVAQVVGHVFLLNLSLGLLALSTIAMDTSLWIRSSWTCFLAAVIAVAFVLNRFS